MLKTDQVLSLGCERTWCNSRSQKIGN